MRRLALVLSAPLLVGLAGGGLAVLGAPASALPLPLPTGSASATPTPTASGTANPTTSPTGSPTGTPAPGTTTTASPSPTATAGRLPLPVLPLPTGGSSASATATTTSSPSSATPTVSVSPATITVGQDALVSGTAPAGAQVELFAYSRPSTQYRRVRTGTASPDGSFTFRVEPAGNTRLYARSEGRDSTSTVLTVRSSLTLAVQRLGTRTYRFTGRVTPRRAGQAVGVSYERGSSRVRAAQARTRADGTWSVDRTFSGTGTLVFVATTGTDITNAGGTSPRRRVAVE